MVVYTDHRYMALLYELELYMILGANYPFQSVAMLRETQIMADPDILRQNLVALVTTMTNQAQICDRLIAARVLTTCNKEEIMCEHTTSARNRSLLFFIRCRFGMGFQPFCQGLMDTRQEHLVRLLCPQMLVEQQQQNEIPQQNEPVVEQTSTVSRNVECSICMDGVINTALIPCGHSLCHQCAERIEAVCPHCRGRIYHKLPIFL